MDWSKAPHLLWVIPAVILFGILSGRAKGARMRELPMTLKSMRLHDWIISVVILAAVSLTARHFIQAENERGRQSVRKTFNLDSKVEFTHFKFRQRSARGFEASAKLSEEQFVTYRRSFDDTAIWAKTSLFTGRQTLTGTFSPGAAAWLDLPKGLRGEDNPYAADRDLPLLYKFWNKDGRNEVKRGRILCYVYHEDINTKGSRISSCLDMPSRTPRQSCVIGVLDFETRELRMTVC